jgi:hypothetical protein
MAKHKKKHKGKKPKKSCCGKPPRKRCDRCPLACLRAD